ARIGGCAVRVAAGITCFRGTCFSQLQLLTQALGLLGRSRTRRLRAVTLRRQVRQLLLQPPVALGVERAQLSLELLDPRRLGRRLAACSAQDLLDRLELAAAAGDCRGRRALDLVGALRPQ